MKCQQKRDVSHVPRGHEDDDFEILGAGKRSAVIERETADQGLYTDLAVPFIHFPLRYKKFSRRCSALG